MKPTKRNIPGLPAGNSPLVPDSRDGCYQCSHCREVVSPSSSQIEVAENAPEADAALKCPHCHKHTVHWRIRPEVGPRLHPRPVSQAQGRELFAGIFRMLAET